MTAQTITPKNWVTDLGDLYTPEQEANLNSIISAYEKKTSIEIGVLTVETLNGQSIEEFTNEQFNKIGIGKKGADNGILIVFSKNDKKSRIETGNGMEPFLSDLDTHEALQVIKPYFRAGNYSTGTVDCVNFIKNKLGNEAFANKVKWLKEKEAKEAKERAAAWESFKSGLIKFVLVACFIGLLVFIYFLDKARREKIRLEQERLRLEEERKQKVRANIVSVEKVIKSTSVNTPSINSAILQSSYNSVDAYIKSLNIKQGTDGDDAYLSKLSNIKNTLISKINAYDRLVNDIKSKMNKIDSLDYAISDAKNYNKEALNALTEIKRYGYYNKDYTDLESSIDKLGVIANTITNNTVKTDVDKAIVDAENLKGNIAYLRSKSGEVIDYLRSIKNAESKIKTSDSVFNTVLSNINRYNSYLKPNELDKVVTEYNNFKSRTNTSDILAYSLLFASTLAIAEALLSKVRGRKEDEEAEARRIVEAARRKKQEEEDRARRKREQEEEEDDRRRRNSYSSSSSYGSSYGSSSSSSSSDFGGFGGGSSSGGGSSDGW